jgi:Tol biopolymer transport system component
MQPGDMLTHYEILAKIGAGGMGEVYRARDTVLDRDVALKILPPEFAGDAERLARFRREAKVLASLNHPNIASIYGLEETPNCIFLVMEMVEGDDLSELLKQGPLAVEDAVAVATQIAEGLEEAHEKGIIHRDLKPANVKRTPEGKVKVLDFGLARAMAGQSAEEEQGLTETPTLTAAVTRAGMIMGTAPYMSPEQARGLAVDRRTDIWAFGVILFEMLTGKQLFSGDTVTDTLASILKTDPEWESLPAGLPFQVERVLRRCLTRNPRQRLRDIGEARVRLEEPDAESGMFSGAIAPLRDDARRWTRLLPWGLAAVTLAALGLVMLGSAKEEPAPPATSIHLAIPSPEGATFQLNDIYPSLPVVSPDGRHVIFGARDDEDGTVQLYLRSLESNQAVALDGTENAQYPFWSPDSKWIAFFDRNEGLKKIPVGGGPDQVICAAGNGKGGSWSPDGIIVFTPSFDTPLHKVPAVGGESVPVTSLADDIGVNSHRHPFFLPDGRRFLYLARPNNEEIGSEIRVASLDGDSTRVLMESGEAVEYASGYLLFMRKQVLMAQSFDVDRLAFAGDPVPIASNILVLGGAAKAAFSVSAEGTLCYLQGKDVTTARLNWLDRKGNESGQIEDQSPFDTAVLSPDQRSIALTILDNQKIVRDLWIYDIDRQFKSRFTFDGADERYPVWSPDGRQLYFSSARTGHYSIFRKAVNGSGPAELVLDTGKDLLVWAVSPDGSTMLYSATDDSTGNDIWAADLTGQAEPRPVKVSPNEDGAARFSPDGRWVSYWSMETGRGQVYLSPWPSLAFAQQVSTVSGTWAFWRGDGREIVYQDEAGKVFAVELSFDGDGVRIGPPTELFDHGTVKFSGPLLDVGADGERLVAIQTVATDPPRFCDIVLGWPTKLVVP